MKQETMCIAVAALKTLLAAAIAFFLADVRGMVTRVCVGEICVKQMQLDGVVTSSRGDGGSSDGEGRAESWRSDDEPIEMIMTLKGWH